MKGSRIRTSAVSFLFVLVVSLVMGGWVGTTPALGDDGTNGESLAGLQGISLAVLPPNPDAERNGLKREQIEKDVEAKLRKAGIKILTGREIEKGGFPYLNINVNAEKDKKPDLYNYDVKVELYTQPMINPEDAEENIGFALYDTIKTWSSVSTGTTNTNDLKTTVQKRIDDGVDKFIAAYLAVNPKKEDKP